MQAARGCLPIVNVWALIGYFQSRSRYFITNQWPFKYQAFTCALCPQITVTLEHRYFIFFLLYVENFWVVSCVLVFGFDFLLSFHLSHLAREPIVSNLSNEYNKYCFLCIINNGWNRIILLTISYNILWQSYSIPDRKAASRYPFKELLVFSSLGMSGPRKETQ